VNKALAPFVWRQYYVVMQSTGACVEGVVGNEGLELASSNYYSNQRATATSNMANPSRHRTTACQNTPEKTTTVQKNGTRNDHASTCSERSASIKPASVTFTLSCLSQGATYTVRPTMP